MPKGNSGLITRGGWEWKSERDRGTEHEAETTTNQPTRTQLQHTSLHPFHHPPNKRTKTTHDQVRPLLLSSIHQSDSTIPFIDLAQVHYNTATTTTTTASSRLPTMSSDKGATAAAGNDFKSEKSLVGKLEARSNSLTTLLRSSYRQVGRHGTPLQNLRDLPSPLLIPET